jgi:hypothetical protein
MSGAADIASVLSGYVKYGKNARTCEIEFDAQNIQHPIVKTLLRDMDDFLRTEMNL